MGLLPWTVLFLASGASSAGAAPFQLLSDRTEVIEKQVELSCNNLDAWANPVQSRLTERVMHPEGAASQIIREVQENAARVSTQLERAEELISRRYETRWEGKLDAAQKKIDRGLASLRQSGGGRTEIREAYSQYRQLKSLGPWRDPELAPSMQSELKSLREQKLGELKVLGDLGARLGTAQKKAAYCRCRLRSEDCSTPERQKEVTDYYKSVATMHSAEYEANYPKEQARSGR